MISTLRAEAGKRWQALQIITPADGVTVTVVTGKDSVNASIDSISLTPTTGFTQNFDLVYQVLTPANVTASRLQTVRKI